MITTTNDKYDLLLRAYLRLKDEHTTVLITAQKVIAEKNRQLTNNEAVIKGLCEERLNLRKRISDLKFSQLKNNKIIG